MYSTRATWIIDERSLANKRRSNFVSVTFGAPVLFDDKLLSLFSFSQVDFMDALHPLPFWRFAHDLKYFPRWKIKIQQNQRVRETWKTLILNSLYIIVLAGIVRCNARNREISRRKNGHFLLNSIKLFYERTSRFTTLHVTSSTSGLQMHALDGWVVRDGAIYSWPCKKHMSRRSGPSLPLTECPWHYLTVMETQVRTKNVPFKARHSKVVVARAP